MFDEGPNIWNDLKETILDEFKYSQQPEYGALLPKLLEQAFPPPGDAHQHAEQLRVVQPSAEQPLDAAPRPVDERSQVATLTVV